MDAGTSEQIKTGEVAEVATGNFPLNETPVDVQLTVHINNLLNTYESQKGQLIAAFKDMLYNPETISMEYGWRRPRQIIEYYGVDVCRNWFMLIYGWDFNEKAG